MTSLFTSIILREAQTATQKKPFSPVYGMAATFKLMANDGAKSSQLADYKLRTGMRGFSIEARQSKDSAQYGSLILRRLNSITSALKAHCQTTLKQDKYIMTIVENENDLDLDRESWLFELADFILTDKIKPLMNGREFPAPLRCAMGYPPRSRGNSKVIAVCIQSAASADGHCEVFVSPKLGDSLEIAVAMVHEMVHFSDDCKSGHRHHFARIARKIGLIGPLTATTANSELTDYLNDIIATLGNIPHAAIDLGLAKKKQSTRMIKVECLSCAFNFRASQTQLDKIISWDCLACDVGSLSITKQ